MNPRRRPYVVGEVSRRRRYRRLLASLLGATLALPAAAAARRPERRDIHLPAAVSTRAAYQAVAAAWGLDLRIEGEDVDRIALRVKLDDVGWEEALELLTRSAGHIWWRDSVGVVHVAADTLGMRLQKFGPPVARSYSTRGAIPQEVATAMRSLGGVSRADVSDGAIEIDTVELDLPVADLIVAAMEGDSPPGWSVRWRPYRWGSSSAATDPRLGTEGRKRLWFPRPTPTDEVLRAIEEAWDIDIVVDPAVQSTGETSLRLESATLFEALDAVTATEGFFWAPLGGRRVVIAEDESNGHRKWEDEDLAVLPLRRADPEEARRILRALRLRSFATGSSPPVALVLDTPERLVLARFVLETLDGRGVLAAPDGGRLWLGSHDWPRRAEARLMIDPGVSEERQAGLAALAPPRLPASFAPGGGEHPAPAPTLPGNGPPRPSRRLVDVLEQDLGLRVATHCYWPRPLSEMMVGEVRGEDRISILDRLTADFHLVWARVGPETIKLFPDSPATRQYAADRGVAAIPLGARGDSVRALAAEMHLDATAEVSSPIPMLFVVGSWHDLGSLLEAARPEHETPERGSSEPRLERVSEGQPIRK